LSIAANDNAKTTCKYIATVTPQGKNLWTLVVEDVKYFVAAPDVEYSRSAVWRQDFGGTEEDARAVACEKIKSLVADRDAMTAVKQFTITEDDING
jgi:hypothetical protein